MFYISIIVLALIISISIYFLNKKEYNFKESDPILEDQYNYIKKYTKHNLDEIEIINGVPKVIYVCWFGHTKVVPKISERRFECLKSIIENSKVDVIILTEDNYRSFEKNEWPIHPSFKHLSGNHKSDYLRAYMLHHYGGYYHDIKYRKNPLYLEWDNFDQEKWLYGRREKEPSHIGDPNIKEHYNDLVSMGNIISKKETCYTRELMEKIDSILENKKELLEIFPAPSERCCYHETPTKNAPKNNYPLGWFEVLGKNFHPLMLKYKDKIQFGLPDYEKGSYI